jgi:pimeloyl-ACP methyl ester carboxylesterase
MVNPQQPELRRSGYGATDAGSAKRRTGPKAPANGGGAAPVPEDNLPGHHPDHEQDKPEGPPRRRGHKAAAGVRPLDVRAGSFRFDGLEAGADGDEVVLLLHGFPQTADAWRPQLEALAGAGYHAIAPNQRGYSEGARPGHAAAYRLDRLVGDAVAIAGEAGADRFHVVGHDWGGVVAWALAARYPRRVRSLTVVSTPHPRALAKALPRSLQALRSSYVGFFSLPAIPERVLTFGGGALLRRALTSTGLPPDAAARYVDALGDPAALGAALNWYRAAARHPGALRSVGELRVPTTFVWGPGDVALGPVAAKGTEAEVQGPYRFEVLDGAGHWIPETRADELTGLVLERVREAA